MKLHRFFFSAKSRERTSLGWYRKKSGARVASRSLWNWNSAKRAGLFFPLSQTVTPFFFAVYFLRRGTAIDARVFSGSRTMTLWNQCVFFKTLYLKKKNPISRGKIDFRFENSGLSKFFAAYQYLHPCIFKLTRVNRQFWTERANVNFFLLQTRFWKILQDTEKMQRNPRFK